MADLKQAAMKSEGLKTVLAQFATGDRATQAQLIDQLLFEWAKTDSKYADTDITLTLSQVQYRWVYNSNSSNIIWLRPGEQAPSYLTDIPAPLDHADNQLEHKVKVLDAFFARKQTDHLDQLALREITYTEKAYDRVKVLINDALISQTILKPYLQSIHVNVQNNQVIYDTSGLNQLLSQNFQANAVNTTLDLVDLLRLHSDELISLGWTKGYSQLQDWVNTLSDDPAIADLINNALKNNINIASTTDNDFIFVRQRWIRKFEQLL